MTDKTCSTCHDKEWIDNGCGVVPCWDCSVTAADYAMFVHDLEALRKAAQAVVLAAKKMTPEIIELNRVLAAGGEA